MKNLFALLLVLPGLCLHAQHQYRFEHLTPENGLSQSQPFTIYQDRTGYLWIGTQDGLNRYDGYEFKIFKSIPFDSTSLSHSWVWNVTEDAGGNLWIGTFRGLCRFIPESEKFVQYFHNPADSASISGNRPNFMVIDKKGRLWISCWGRGLNVYDQERDAFKSFLHNPADTTSLDDDYIRTMYCGRDGTIWIGTWNSDLNKVTETADGFKFESIAFPPSLSLTGGYKITSITEDNQNNLWIATYERGLIQYNLTTHTFTQHFPHDKFNSLLIDAGGNLWAGSLHKGLFLLPAGEKTFINISYDSHNSYGISSNNIYSLFQDKAGILWVGANGVDYYDPRKSVFKNYQNKPGDPTSLKQNLVWTFCQDNKKNLWIGTESGPLEQLDPSTGTFNHIALRDRHGNTAGNFRKIVHHEDVLYIGTYGSGLVAYNTVTRETSFLIRDKRLPHLSKMLTIQDLLVDGDTLWVGSNGSGLLCIDLKTLNSRLYKFDAEDPGSLASNYVNALFKDSQGNIWSGGWGGGFSILNRKTETFTSYSHNPKNRNSLSSDIVNCIFQESDSIWWLATNDGLNRFNRHLGQFKHYFESDGLANNVVYQIHRDSEGYLWLSTNMGLSRFNSSTEEFLNYTQADGLPANEFNANASFQSEDGTLYFGTIHGFTVFHPRQIKKDNTFPPVVVQSFRVNDQLLPFTFEKPFYFSHDQNFFHLNFTAIEFSSPQKIRYAYKIKGFDKNWVEIGNHRSVTYTNLNPGSYTFYVKSTNADGSWNEQPAAVVFTIAPPFWKTWWFMALSIFVSVTLAYSIHRYRVTQSVKLERLRNKIARDLHDEVGSSLTRISIYSDLLQNGVDESKKKSYLKNISTMSREIISTMSDIVWSIDNHHDTVGALIMRMKDFASEVLQAKNINFDFQSVGIDEGKTIDPALKQNLYLIFKEAVNNIVKHALATRVSVKLSHHNSRFEMIIEDNGTGFNPEKVTKGHGLRNMQRRASMADAAFEISSSKGTILTISCNSF